MIFKKQGPQQGIRTRSDYVPDSSKQTSSDAQRAAALMFKKQVPNAPDTTAKNPQTQTAPKRSPKRQVQAQPQAPAQRTRPKFSIHSYATNKVISINGHNKVTATTVAPSNGNVVRKSSVARRRSVAGNTKPQQQQQQQQAAPAAPDAAMAAASIVARAHPKSMLSPDSTMVVEPAPVPSASHSRSASVSSGLTRSPYSFVAPTGASSHRHSGAFSFKDSHSSLQLNRLSISTSNNRSSLSLVSPRDTDAPAVPAAPVADVAAPVAGAQAAEPPSGIQSDPIPEHTDSRKPHPYAGLLLASPILKGGFSDAGSGFAANNYSNGSDLSSASDLFREKSVQPAAKKSDDFLYQSPLVAMKKGSVVSSMAETEVGSDAGVAQQPAASPPKRKPPPAIETSGSFLKPPALSKRLSLSSDFDVETSPQLSQHSFNNSSAEDLKSKKTRKPPPDTASLTTPLATPLATPSAEKRNSYLQIPTAAPYEGTNESQLTFGEEMASLDDSTTLNESVSQLPQYPTYTSGDTQSHHHHPHLPYNKRTRKLKNSARALFGRSQPSTPVEETPVYYFGAGADHGNTNLNPATMSQTAILVPQQTVKLKTTMRKDKKSKEFNEDKPWKHHTYQHSISDVERKRYEGVWVANRELCMDLKPKEEEETGTEESLKAAQTAAASQKLNANQLMHGIIVREIFKRSRLPPETLKRIYNLVDRSQDGFLRKDEFIVGMWLIDQCLYGRKLPKQLDDDVWESVHNTSVVGVKISIGKKKSKKK